MQLPEIVGIAGTNGAGKDTLGRLLSEMRNFQFVSFSDVLRAELDVQGLPHEREHLRALSSQWYREHGPDYMAERTITLYQKEKEQAKHNGLAIGSVRRVSEAEVIRRHGGVIIWIDAEPRVRYDRLQAAARGRVDDRKSFEQWSKEEAIEMSADPNDESSLNAYGVKALADESITNDFNDLTSFEAFLVEHFRLS